MNKIQENLKKLIISQGASLVGFSKPGAALPDEFSELPYAITVAVRLSDFIIDQIKDKPTYTYFHHYRAVNTLIDQITLRTMIYLQDNGYKCFAVPASQTVNDAKEKYMGVFPHKTAAVLSGLGWIGRNGLFISHEYGPRVRLGTVLTDLTLEVSENTYEDKCGECGLCVQKCPAAALTGNSWSIGSHRSIVVDAKACSDYMNGSFKGIGRGSVCGICMRVCPKGTKR